jgi:hypothetical protein
MHFWAALDTFWTLWAVHGRTPISQSKVGPIQGRPWVDFGRPGGVHVRGLARSNHTQGIDEIQGTLRVKKKQKEETQHIFIQLLQRHASPGRWHDK